MAGQPQINLSSLPRSTDSPFGYSASTGEGGKGTHALQADRKGDMENMVYVTAFNEKCAVDDDVTSNYDGDRDDETSAADQPGGGLCSPESYAEFSVNPYLWADSVQDGFGNPEPVQKVESGYTSRVSSVSRRTSVKFHRENMSETFTKLSNRVSGVYRRYSSFKNS